MAAGHRSTGVSHAGERARLDRIVEPFGNFQRQIDNPMVSEELHRGATSLAHLQAPENRCREYRLNHRSNYMLYAHSITAIISTHFFAADQNRGWRSRFLCASVRGF